MLMDLLAIVLISFVVLTLRDLLMLPEKFK
jgi:hypothetical protein